MVLVYGPGSKRMGREVAELLGIEPVLVEHRIFPDGESHLRVAGDVVGLDVVLVHSTAPPQDARMVQLLFTLDVLREGAESVTVVAPYLAYARQDRRQAPGEAVSITSVIRLLRALDVSKLVTVNVHNPAVFEGQGLVLCDVSAVPLLADHFLEEGFGGSFSLSLGKKPVDVRHAEEAASVLGGGFARLETFRNPSTGRVTLGEPDFEVDGLRVVVFDDVVSSGGTHLRAVELLRGMGAAEVHLACVHSLLAGERLEAVRGAFDGFVCTDTVPNEYSRVGVAPLLADAIREG
ncbi:MAG: ribose-phosphate diphosphokinase [Candidatus Bathyarchaeota archaeon]|nr:MAG: ribose-phosphate diphosphokinase [Candidatus Bathyarchaeota archaeon]